MPEKPVNDEQRLRRVFDALADSVEGLTEEELLAEAREEGDPKSLAAEVTRLIAKMIGSHNARKRIEARLRYEARIAAMGQRRYDLPTKPEERRALLDALVARTPAIRSAITLHHRELKSLSDDDVEGYLKKLVDLALLGPSGESKG